MTMKNRILFAPFGLVAALAICAGPAGASCVPPGALAAATGRVPAGALHLPAGWVQARGVSGAGIDAKADKLSIAGYWKFTYHDADGNVGDFGYQSIDLGGNEMLVSFARPPGTGDVCSGVWKETQPHHFKLSHFAPIFDTDNVTFLGTYNAIYEVTLSDDGQSFDGPAEYTGYDTSGNIMFQGSFVASGTRVKVNTPVF